MRSIKNIILKCLPAILLLTACDVAEDKTDCVVDMQITFRFTKDGTDRFGVEVPSLSVFVFDDGNSFVGRWDEYDNTKFSTDYTMKLPLMPGTYSFVVWGGLKDDNYYVSTGEANGQSTPLVVGQTAMSDVHMRLRCDTRNSYAAQKHYVDYLPGTLFFGKTGKLTLANNTNNNVTVDLSKSSTKINLTIVGMPEPVTRANPYTQMDISLDSPNGGYDFWNGVEEGCNTFTYIQHDADQTDADVQTSSFHTLKMQFDNGHILTIYNTETGRDYYTADLLEDYIRKVPAYSSQDAVDAEEEFDITLDVRSQLGVEVTVNGWNVGISGNIIQ